MEDHYRYVFNIQYGRLHLTDGLGISTKCGKDTSRNYQMWVNVSQASAPSYSQETKCRRCFRIPRPAEW